MTSAANFPADSNPDFVDFALKTVLRTCSEMVYVNLLATTLHADLIMGIVDAR
jgi:hypothetical protein